MPSNPYYDHATFPQTNTRASSALLRAELDTITAGFDKLPPLTGNASEIVTIKSDVSGLESKTTAELNLLLNTGGTATGTYNLTGATVNLGTATGATQTHGANTTALATCAFVQDAAFTSGVNDLLTDVAGGDTITAVAPVTSYIAGHVFNFIAAARNTGPVTINLNSLGAKAIVKQGAVPLAPGDVVAGQMVTIIYNGTNFDFAKSADYLLSVKDFGAAGDGATDDTAAIQAAITYIEAQTGDRGGSIFFPRGDYKITTSLTILGAGVVLYGEGATTEYGELSNEATSRIVWGGTTDSSSTYMLVIGDLTQGAAVTRRVTIQNLGLDGNGYVSGIASTWAPEMILVGVSFNDLHYGHTCASSGGYGRNYSNTWSSCYFHDFKDVALQLKQDCHRSNILQCHFTSTASYVPTSCIQIGGTDYASMVNITGCNFEPYGNNGSSAIYWIDAVRVKALNVTANYFEVPSGTSISACICLGSTSTTLGAMISGNRMVIRSDAPDYASLKSPIEAVKAYACQVSGNYFETWNGVGVSITGTSGNIRDIFYSGNYGDALTGSMTSGFNLRNYSFDLLDNVHIYSDFVIGHTATNTFTLQAKGATDALVINNADYAGVEVLAGVATTATSNAAFRPSSDGLQRLGSSVKRWSEIFASTGTINTSDETEKSLIEEIPQAWLDAWGKVKFYRYKFNESVSSKGAAARWHIGVVAQRVKDVFAAHGINAFSIGLLCYDEEEGKPMYGIRYEEALIMECAYLRSKIAAIKP